MPKDNPAADIKQIILDSTLEDWKQSPSPALKINQIKLMTDLSIYIADRDARVWDQAYNAGRRFNELADD